MDDQVVALHDLRTFNIRGQIQKLLQTCPASAPHAPMLRDATTYGERANALAKLLLVPALTSAVAKFFRPILTDICARLLHDDELLEEKFVALASLLHPHIELFSILLTLLSRPFFSAGPLAFASPENASSLDASRLQTLLVAYYRILTANPNLPEELSWPLHPLLALFRAPHPDAGVRFLAIRCHSLQTRTLEGERDELEKELVGHVVEMEVPIRFEELPDGQIMTVEACLFVITEARRVQDARNSLVDGIAEFYRYEHGEEVELLDLSQLSPYVANVHGVLLLKSTSRAPMTDSLIHTPTAIKALQSLAAYYSLRYPTLLSSPPSSGKSSYLYHLAAVLHPEVHHQIISLHLSDTSLDPRSLLGSYISSPTTPGTFEWREGALVKAMKEGKWVVLADIDRASSEVLGVLSPLVGSLDAGRYVGGRALINVPGRGTVKAHPAFALFATRTIRADSTVAKPTFLGAHRFAEVIAGAPASEELRAILDARVPRLAGSPVLALVNMWQAIRALGSNASLPEIGLRQLEQFCVRVDAVIPSSYRPMDLDEELEIVKLSSVFRNPTVCENILLEARDVFFGAGAPNAAAKAHLDTVVAVIGDHLGLEAERRDTVLYQRAAEVRVDKDGKGRIRVVHAGRVTLAAKETQGLAPPQTRPFAMHRPVANLIARIASAVALAEPVLLAGETGTGKTSAVAHLATLLARPLTALNMSHQTEAADLVGGFRPVDARVPGGLMQERFIELFSKSFSRKKNAKFEEATRKAVSETNWKRACVLWKEAGKLAREKLSSKAEERPEELDVEGPRKRRKTEAEIKASQADWNAFDRDVEAFSVQHVQNANKFAFTFNEGPLVKALRTGGWVLLDEINLASPETLESIASLLRGPTASITLTELGSLEPVPRHPDFRLFACMNPATDVGKKDLPPHIRSRFTEIDVPPPDADRDTLLAIIGQYIGGLAVADKAAIMDVADFYSGMKKLSEDRKLADGNNHRPHFSMRTLARTLAFASDTAPAFGLRRALWEGVTMAFMMGLDQGSYDLARALAEKCLFSGKNMRAILGREPNAPAGRSLEDFVRLGSFYLERGPTVPDAAEDYILTPSVERKLIDLARIVATRRFSVLIEGPTSAGKTSAVEYLARRTGHRFVRINNHEHTDIQEYIGTYVSDPTTGKLTYTDGLLVRALRNGDWIVLDELNLAPTEVLEALNRLLDDNRELIVPETGEVVQPHPHFMLFATQNPPGLYGGRKILSRAFRNRFLEVHFADVPQAELETILCQRARIAPSYATKIVAVFSELQKRRQAARVFDSKQGFATLRDLFRWAGRGAVGYQQLAEDGYMLLAERARRADDKVVVKEIIENIMKVRIDEKTMYDLQSRGGDLASFLDQAIPSANSLVWTSAMRRVYILVARALRFNEPVLLVGETGCGKTSVCQVFAAARGQELHTVSCHQNSETADFIGGLRPVRNKAASAAQTLREAETALAANGVPTEGLDMDGTLSLITSLLEATTTPSAAHTELVEVQKKLVRLNAIFEWHDGPLVDAMRDGEVFLMDEISLADDSVLERLNSVLEPHRTLVLAERGGGEVDDQMITASPEFKLVATMNPGGDYGKKELSPALRNRFTEIWVPPVNERADLEQIVDSLWKHDALQPYTSKLLNFAQWLAERVHDSTICGIRDLLAWVQFSDAVYSPELDALSPNAIFHHAARMTFLDGLESFPQVASYSREALQEVRTGALQYLQQLIPLERESTEGLASLDTSRYVQLGSFAISRGTRELELHSFNLQVPTTRENAMRVFRAGQLMKPILLEGSPGVGKTTLITALANISGHHLCRINLSDQTDLMDLFGSDLPVEGGSPGEFAWKDAEFLRALQEGHWVLLDEMNLAPQAVLEGLNAVLDHRGTVFIPELGRSFTRHPSFRIFAAQNPLQQGGGRKGLPKSFVNRFTKVYVDELSPSDLLLVIRHLFPAYPAEILQRMIEYNARLNEEVAVRRSFGKEGAPWEFNLRDVIRWATLLDVHGRVLHPAERLWPIYLSRFRTDADRQRASLLFDSVFGRSATDRTLAPHVTVTSTHLQIGSIWMLRKRPGHSYGSPPILQAHATALETVALAVEHNWLAIITGHERTGKKTLVESLARLMGNTLQSISVNSNMDTSDILGSFEQTDSHSQTSPSQGAHFEWVDGILLHALRQGHWLLMDNANLCNPSVLDRLNSLCEPNGTVVLNERGQVNGEVQVITPHPNFRLFMTVDPRYGELSRAMRNRGVEVALTSALSIEDSSRLVDHLHLPTVLSSVVQHRADTVGTFEYMRRGVKLGHDLHSEEVTADRTPVLLSLSDDTTAGAVTEYASALAKLSDIGFEDDSFFDFAASALPRRLLRLLHRMTATRNVKFGNFLSALHEFGQSGIGRRVQDTYAKSRGVPSSLLLAQPLDIYMNHPPLSLCAPDSHKPEMHEVLLHALQLWTTLASPRRAAVADAGSIVQHGRIAASARYVQGIADVLSALTSSSHSLLQGIHEQDLVTTSDEISRSLRLIRMAQYLDIVGSQVPFNFSAAQVISSWMVHALPQDAAELMHIAGPIHALHENLALLSGHGMTELWSALVTLIDDRAVYERFSKYEHVVLPSDQRMHLIQAASVLALPSTTLRQHPEGVDSLLEQVDQVFSGRLQGIRSPEDGMMMALAELDVLSGLETLNTERVRALVDLVCTRQTGALTRFCVYQWMIWALDASSDLAPVSILASKRWLEAIWQANDGPSGLLEATQLRTTVQKCDWRSSPLSALEECNRVLEQHKHVLRYRSTAISTTRLDGLSRMLTSMLKLSMSCFGCTWPLESVPAEQTDQVAFGSRVLPPPVFLAAQLRLPTPLQLQGGDRLNTLGKGWIAHGQFLLDIYVPDKPVDPAAMALCAVDYWTQEQSRLKGMLRHHSLLEQHTTGNSTNLIMDWLRTQITVVEQELESAKKGTAPSPRDVKTVHAFWAEVAHFRHEVLSQGKIEHLVQSLDVGAEGSQMREQVMQESIAGLCQRLDVGYSTLLDLSAPIHWALFQLKLGLRLLSHSIELRQDIHLDEKIPLYRSFVVFPTVHAVDLLHDRPWQGSRHSSSPATTLQLYLLASAMNEQSGGIGIARMDEMFEQVLLLWLKDRANEDQAAKDAQSLFKSKTIDYDAMTELEAEEEEFRSLFPTYDDVEGHQEKASQQGGPSLDAEHLQAIVRVHLDLFSTHEGGSSTRTVFNRLRETLLEDLVATPSLLPETLDQDGFATQLSLVHHRSLAARSINPSTGFDFYHDASIPEAEKAAKIVQAMNLRLEELIQEWPDQMVLQHLRDRCQTVLGLSLVSPIAKILTSLEQLLLQSEDWEMYANRHNSLRTYREDLTKTIVDWRRLELSCWSTLLQVQLRVFEDQAAEWWPNLYNVCVRGALAVAVDTEAASLDKYLDDLVPLVDNLLASSPLGQLARRLEMVQAFAHLLDGLISSRSEREGDILRRVGNILRTTGDYYRQFTPAIATSFNQQRAALEKDIRGYIKLASWKDVNVQALKASAVRTHHQLYKTIRKFRDIMRQPITPHLTLDGQSEKSIANPPSDYSFPIADEHDSRMPIRIEGSSSRAADLPRTLTMFDSFVKERIVPAISSRDSINIDHLASDIIQRSQTLARATIPADTPSEKRASAQKALFVLKRKAWTDLLKELKRIGLATAVKPDILERQRNLRWLREQRGLGRDDDIGVETYIQRVQVVLPQLRNALADHHADLSTRDLNRATMFVESGLEFGLEARSRAAGLSREAKDLDNVVRRLEIIAESPVISQVGVSVTAQVLALHMLADKLWQALVEIGDHIDIAKESEFEVPVGIKEEVLASASECRTHAGTLKELRARVGLCKTPLLLQAEVEVLIQARTFFDSVFVLLQRLLASAPALRHLFHPTLQWFEEQRQSILPVSSTASSSSTGCAGADTVLDTLLVVIQNLLTRSSLQADADGEDNDSFLRDHARVVRQITDALALGDVLARTNAFITSLPDYRVEDVQPAIAAVLPFLKRFLALAHHQFQSQAAWARSLLKLTYVLARTALTVAKEGFCRPPDSESEGGDGEGKALEGAEGTGLGAGQGAEDVSKEIEDESQVEGLQGEQDEKQEGEKGEGDAIEMSEDFAGDMQDVDKGEDDQQGEDDKDEDEEDGPEPEDQLGDLDPMDPEAVDEKLWSGEKGPEDDRDDQRAGEGAEQTGQEESEMGAKEEGKKEQPKKEDAGDQPREVEEATDEQQLEETGEEVDQPQEPTGEGTQMDDHVQEADTLDLPAELDLDGADDDMEPAEDDEDMAMDEDEQEVDGADIDGPEDERQSTPRPEDAPQPDDAHQPEDAASPSQGPDATHEASGETAEEDAPEDPKEDTTTANPDVSAGPTNAAADASALDHEVGDAVPEDGQAESVQRTAGNDAGDQQGAPEDDSDDRDDKEPSSDQQPPQSGEAGAGSQDPGGTQGVTSALPRGIETNPLRDLGQALNEIRKQFNDILNANDQPSSAHQPTQPADSAQLEYVRPDEDAEMEALGPAGEEEAARLSDLKLIDDEAPVDQNDMVMDIDEPEAAPAPQVTPLPKPDQDKPSSALEGLDSAVTDAEVRAQGGTRRTPPPEQSQATRSTETDVPDEEVVEAALKKWHDEGRSEEDGAALWRLYEGLTHDLAHTLCEQLRLVLAPTLATRLRGDYRTGKRLNMKKVVPYVASEFRKDRIWLRRTRPSARAYQVLLAIDDSRSMAAGRSVHLAFETLALVARALGRLEVGQVALARFGRDVDILHAFEDGPLGDAAGARALGAFSFNQQATDVLGLLRKSLHMLADARARQSGAEELWQLMVVVSDGVCQDHDALRAELRRAEEARVLVVFVVLDALHTHTAQDGPGASILSMTQVRYQEVAGGAREMVLERYMDSFPFEYYVVLRRAEALPDVLASTLRQFFERVAGE